MWCIRKSRLVAFGAWLILTWPAYLAAQQDSERRMANEDLVARAAAVLEKHCLECHGADTKKVKGKLNLLDRDALLVKKVIVPGVAAESLLIQRMDDRDEPMPPSDRPRVSAAERETLRAWIAAGAPAIPRKEAGNPGKAPADAAGAELAGRVQVIFQDRCFDCHGGTTTSKKLRILDHAQLLDKRWITPGRPEESPLYRTITGEDAPSMPYNQRPLNAEDQNAIRAWIVAGAPAFPQPPALPKEEKQDKSLEGLAGVEYVHRKILDHVRFIAAGNDRNSLPFLRFFSINHLLVGRNPETELKLHRQALVKALNHLSWRPELVPLQSIDEPFDTVFVVDLRSLGWEDRPFTVGVPKGAKPTIPPTRAKLNSFDLVLLEYPYGVVYEDSRLFDNLAREFLSAAEQVRPVVFVRADWFVSLALQPPLYHDLLRLPRRIEDLEKKLGVNSQDNLKQLVALRGGLSVSNVSHHNRAVERHPTSHGSYWKSFDYRSSVGRDNIFKDPLNLQPAGGEMIFTLPNQLQGYFVTDANGTRIDSAGTEIVTDGNALDQTVRNGLSCMRCHVEGMIRFEDKVRPALEPVRGRTIAERERILDLYRGQKELDAVLTRDRRRFVDALTRLHSGPPPRSEPLKPVSKRFLEAPLNLTRTSLELGLVQPEEFLTLVKVAPFAPLGLTPLGSGGVIRRDAWEDYFDRVIDNLSIGTAMVPLDGSSRWEYAAANALPVTLKADKNIVRAGDLVHFEVHNGSQKDVHFEMINTDSEGQSKILVHKTRLAPGTPYVLTWKIGPGRAKDRVTMFASDDDRFPAGVLLSGNGYVADRVVHDFYRITPRGLGVALSFDPKRLIKKSLVIETQ